MGLLVSDARMSAAAIAKHVGLTERTVRNRIEWLKTSGHILGMHAVLRADPSHQDALLMLEFSVGVASADAKARFRDALAALPGLVSIDVLDAGEFVVRLRCQNAADVIEALALGAGVRLDVIAVRTVAHEIPVGRTRGGASPGRAGPSMWS